MNDDELDLTNPEMLRLKAEQKLKMEYKKADNHTAELDAKKLLHELQVHQVELEMQNEELKHAIETAETALKKYTILYDLAPMGYLTLDSESRICELNFTAAEMLGKKRFSLIHNNFKLFVAEDSLPVYNDFFRKIYSTNSKESCELTLAHDNTILGFVYVEGILTEEEQECLLGIVDISGFVNR